MVELIKFGNIYMYKLERCNRCSKYKLKNTSGSGIGLHHEVDKLASPNSNICIGYTMQANAILQIEEEMSNYIMYRRWRFKND